jgi:hypothetical protein
MMKRGLLIFLAAATLPVLSYAQFPGQGRGPAQPPRPAKEAAPINLTGDWVSVVTEDYRWRMVTPLKGDAASIPYRQDARRVIDAWDPAKDEAAGLQCKAYAAPGLMRIPGRLRINWQDDSTLKIETDAGTQTRVFHFAPPGGQIQVPANTQPSWQGYSIAKWEGGIAPASGGIPLGLSARFGARSRSLEVVTTNLREGYLRKNGVPFSDKTTLTEYYDRFDEPNGDQWFTVTTIVNDPMYLATPFVTTTDFKKEANGSKFSPAPCLAR